MATFYHMDKYVQHIGTHRRDIGAFDFIQCCHYYESFQAKTWINQLENYFNERIPHRRHPARLLTPRPERLVHTDKAVQAACPRCPKPVILYHRASKADQNGWFEGEDNLLQNYKGCNWEELRKRLRRTSFDILSRMERLEVADDTIRYQNLILERSFFMWSLHCIEVSISFPSHN